MSIHIAAQKGQIADRILLPGDPLRAKFVAENYLEGAFCFNEVRNMFGYTGTYRGKPISVMGTGMGMPSLSIYVNELIREYDVNKLIRIGTCGSMLEYLNVRDIVLAMSACTDSAANHLRFKGMDYAPTASFRLLKAAWDAATSRGLRVFAGSILSSDMFYTEDPEQWKLWAKFGVLAVEMETAELYTLAAKFGCEALSVLTVSDDLVKGEITSAEERQSSFNEMVELALDAIFA
ncbi:MAG TPA: purine-nucleoside phosphorylase [Rectinema sp.]|jgi:purine-nucleoside phosphorylase|nr:purine-nucleoside phosphorylase [Treponema sp.]OQC73587.1 MAG: Purine nucleoside phosphorylase DeoD-type [Spirochaetes bacterium ADurb.Bin001]HNV35902.1 purine-nucleoside phosphorylase [Rectinema sp.]HNZ93688.1 purine-nucleoside phosphorylase [Rectinema sp.]HOD58395.1 purine-nucleoside phosphorylase [Rectinema sp.]